MKKLTFGLCLWLFSGLPLAGAASLNTQQAVVRLPEKVTVIGPQISLGDVADVIGQNKAVVEKIRRVDLGRAPLAGQKLKLTQGYVKIALRRSGYSLKDVSVDGAETTEVLTQSQEFSTAGLLPELKKFVLGQMNESPENVTVKLMGEDKKIGLPAGKVGFRFRPSFSGKYEGPVLMTVEMEVSGREVRTLPLRVLVEVYRPVVLTTKRVEKGDKFSKENVALVREPTSKVPSGCLQEIGNVLGRTAAVPLVPGTVLRLNYITDPPVIRHGQVVSAVVRRGNVEISVAVRAIEDGKAGDTIRVENTESHAVIRGKVLDERTVLIDAEKP